MVKSYPAGNIDAVKYLFVNVIDPSKPGKRQSGGIACARTCMRVCVCVFLLAIKFYTFYRSHRSQWYGLCVHSGVSECVGVWASVYVCVCMCMCMCLCVCICVCACAPVSVRFYYAYVYNYAHFSLFFNKSQNLASTVESISLVLLCFLRPAHLPLLRERPSLLLLLCQWACCYW